MRSRTRFDPPAADRLLRARGRVFLAMLALCAALPSTALGWATTTISAAFTRACQFLEIDDLHFHDLRHEGISRLFEMGKTIPQVAAVSGHRTWNSLKRYTHLRQAGDKYAGWKWLPVV